MFIKLLKLKNFRNYEELNICFDKGINFLSGLNGEGKTNILEAISLLSLGKSFVTSNEKECVRINKEFSKINSIIERKNNLEIEIVISEQGKKILINNNEIKRLSEMSGNVYVITFSPKDVSFYKESAVRRRKFIDSSLSMLSPAYLSCISIYKKLIKERNSLLKQDVDFTLLKVIDEQLAPLEFEIIKMRYKFINELNNSIKKLYEKFNINNTEVNLSYLSTVPYDVNKEKCIKNILQQLEESYSTDLSRKNTSKGIHHEDVEFFYKGTNIALTGSQGQNRIATLILKIALADLIKEKFLEEPILLLDDVLSELDENHQRLLGSVLKDYSQSFITGTEIPATIDVDTEFIVSNHSIRRNEKWMKKKF